MAEGIPKYDVVRWSKSYDTSVKPNLSTASRPALDCEVLLESPFCVTGKASTSCQSSSCDHRDHGRRPRDLAPDFEDTSSFQVHFCMLLISNFVPLIESDFSTVKMTDTCV